MKKAYPVILTIGCKSVLVEIPDFNSNTQGINLVDAIAMARDAIGLIGIDMEDEKEKLPEPSNISEINIKSHTDIITLVDIDFSEYRRKNDTHAVKKNCTIPSWLNFQAEKAGINFSAVLQNALKKELGLDK